jgi:hypothetical protein
MIGWVVIFSGITAYALHESRSASDSICKFVRKDGEVRVFQASNTQKLVRQEIRNSRLENRKAAGAYNSAFHSAALTWQKLAEAQTKNYLASLALVELDKSLPC